MAAASLHHLFSLPVSIVWYLGVSSQLQTHDCSPFSVLNVFALINILLHMPGHDLTFTTLRIVGVSLPAVSSVVCTLTAGLLYRECREKNTSPAPLLNPNEQELQRRQLLRLLEEQSSSAPSPELVRNTYRFDLPDDAQNTWKPIAHE